MILTKIHILCLLMRKQNYLRWYFLLPPQLWPAAATIHMKAAVLIPRQQQWKSYCTLWLSTSYYLLVMIVTKSLSQVGKRERKEYENHWCGRGKLQKYYKILGMPVILCLNHTKKIPARNLRLPCGEKCHLRCKSNFDELLRQQTGN